MSLEAFQEYEHRTYRSRMRSLDLEMFLVHEIAERYTMGGFFLSFHLPKKHVLMTVTVILALRGMSFGAYDFILISQKGLPMPLFGIF
jgi:hypothetical protein